MASRKGSTAGKTKDQLRQTTLTPEFEIPGVREEDLHATAEALFAAKRVVFVTGAGISVSAGIPDFRSKDGLYALAKSQHASEVVKGQDLFDAGVFRSERTTRVFYSFMAGLRQSSLDAKPTPTHSFLRHMEQSGNLLRCYTQNIDGLEHRAGLDEAHQQDSTSDETEDETENCSSTTSPCPSPVSSIGSPSEQTRSSSPPVSCSGSVTKARRSPPAAAAPKVVQLHGSLAHVRCVVCARVYRFNDTHATEFAQGTAPPCPGCAEEASMRSALGKRSRVTGVLRPDVVLYNEIHPLGDTIAQAVSRDVRKRPDMLVVMGTSLKVVGIKRLVRDFAAAVHAFNVPDEDTEDLDDLSSLGSSTQSSEKSVTLTRRRRSTKRRYAMVVLVNKTPLGCEWDDVFDHCLTADVDSVVNRWLMELTHLQSAADARKAKRQAARAKTQARAEGLPEERGQTRLSFPVVKNPPSMCDAWPNYCCS